MLNYATSIRPGQANASKENVTLKKLINNRKTGIGTKKRISLKNKTKKKEKVTS